MSSGIGLVLVVALLCAAGGLLLWKSAQDNRERALTDRFVDRRVASVQGATPVEMPGTSPSQNSQRTRSATLATLSPSAARHGVRENVRHLLARTAYGFGNLMSRAGIASGRTFLLSTGAMILPGACWVGMRTHWMVALGCIVFGMLCAFAFLSWRAQKRYQRISRQLPVFLDGIVRLITIGNSVPAAFQSALTTADAPLRDCLDRVSRMLRSGVDIEVALKHVASVYRVRELELVGSVLRISVKYGGRSDVMLDRMAALMRDLEQAERELIALSTETRLSAWVLGLLPALVGGFVLISNPSYFQSMWSDPFGRRLVYMALGLQAFGAFLLYRMARLKDWS
ncbi:Type II secretion system (T2SS), protein F [Caballeronia sp. SBC1]|uniref:type II secretion system F family protein n=1 Tax=unclassified Caballeronia TaxID=2646786 RepID=UPI0013E15544|nr:MULTISPECIES: type II secretion system F family protein [unclassified Caballeronia]QIE24176.1 Type II secretion system (T2SS), protein F [Caballeronia sp. SBC2]QIN62072.1 Type II secretion system (T2SS), protein F [Caballeronia sp. SBC1]